VSAAATPELAVIVASRDRREKLRRCLDSLGRQSQDPADFEVIVADDGSEDGTAAMVESFDARHRLRLLRLERAGKASAVNAAIEATAAPVCLFLDDDVIASPGLVAAHLDAHRKEPSALGIGRLTQPPPAGDDWFGVAHAAAWNARYDELARRQPDWPDCYGGNFSAPRESLREVGGIAAHLPAIEDIELGYRLCAAGCVPRYLPAAEGVHDDHKSADRLTDDMRRYGAFCAEFAERRADARRKLLSWFLATTPREVTLRRLILALRLPPGTLVRLGAAIPGGGRRAIWVGFVSRYCFWLGARSAMGRARWKQTTRGVPVLMYHAFSNREEGDRYILSRRAFARQLRLLRLLRYRAIGFEQLGRALAAGEAPPSRSVVLTIDDGYRDNLEVALPLLRSRRLPATLFLISRRFGATNEWSERSATAGRQLLSEEEARDMRAGGVAIGAHTRTHPHLPTIGGAELAAEVSGSRADLEELFDEPIVGFAYPYGGFDRRAVEAVRVAGFAAACTVESRPARLGDDPLLIPRIEVEGDDSLPSFLRKLWFGA